MTDILEKSQARQRLRSLSEALDSGALKQVARILNGGLSPSDIAHLLESSPPRQRALLWNLVDKQLEGEVLQYLNDDIRGYFLSQLNAQELADIIEDFESDDLADLLQQLPDTGHPGSPGHHGRAGPSTRRGSPLLPGRYRRRPDEHGHPLRCARDISIDVVLRYLRRHRNLPPMTDSLIVVSRRDEFIGMLPITKMLVSNPAATVREVMDTDIEPIPVTLSDTKVATLFERYDLISAPVVSEEGRLLGRITIDDVVDVIREDADHSLMSMAGLDEDEDTFAPILKTTRRRAVWLGINLLTAFTASAVIGLFEATIEKVVALAVLMPIVASMGGIAGSQTLTLVIRGMAVGQISGANVGWLLNREFIAGALNGLLWAVVVASAATLWFSDIMIGAIIAAALIINLIAAALVGTVLPLFRVPQH